MVRVLIVSPHRLFGPGLEAWLRQQQGLDVVGCEADVDKLDERMQQLEPDVVILDTSDCKTSPATALMRFLAARPGAKIIGVDLRDNSIRIFGREERAMALVEELLEAIKGQAQTGGQPS
jgi:DNA-binding NarL/FixJ family response regulator